MKPQSEQEKYFAALNARLKAKAARRLARRKTAMEVGLGILSAIPGAAIGLAAACLLIGLVNCGIGAWNSYKHLDEVRNEQVRETERLNHTVELANELDEKVGLMPPQIWNSGGAFTNTLSAQQATINDLSNRVWRLENPQESVLMLTASNYVFGIATNFCPTNFFQLQTTSNTWSDPNHQSL